MRLNPFLLALVLLAALAAPAQEDEGAVYFALTTDRPVRPGESVPVRVSANGVKRLQFRLYKVNDPDEFFRKLDDPHRSGTAVERPARQLTPIEKFARWKRRLRIWMQNLVRAQFSSENRKQIRSAWLTPKPQSIPSAPGTASEYAAVPVLNPQQVVRVWEQPVETAARWETITVPVVLKDGGLYLLEATDGQKRAYTIASATNLALITKTTQKRLLVRTVDRTTGEPVAGCPVRLMSNPEKKEIGQAKTGPDGLAEFVPSKLEADSILVTSQCNKMFAVSSVGSWYFSDAAQRQIHGYVYTDRPVYRPGHKVHLKSILRRATLGGYEVLQERTAEVEIQNPEGQPVLKQTVPVSGMGTAAADFALPATAPLGYYMVQVNAGGDTVHSGFHVEEYRKPDYEVRAIADKARVIQGDSLTVNVEARYYYGEPVAGGKVTWAVFRTRHWMPWYTPDEEMALDYMEEDYAGEQVDEGEGQLNAEGKLAIPIRTAAAEWDVRYRVEARVTDASNREIAGSGFVVATRGPFFIHARPRTYVYEPGQTAQIEVETRDYDGKMVPNVSFSAELVSYPWDAKRRTTLAVKEGSTGGDGRGSVYFPVDTGGSYSVQVTARTQHGTVKGDTWVWVSGAGAWGGRQERIQIIPDRPSYKPGDTARMLVVTGGSGANVWLSVEGRGVHWSRMLEVKGASATVDIPVEAAWAPNVFVEAVFIRDNTLFRGSRMLKVPATDKLMQVEVAASKAEYQPGEPAQFTVTAKDHSGRPVAAEFSLGVVDEAIYAVKREMQGDITQVFYGRQWNRVGTDSSMFFYFYGTAGTRRVELARLRPRDARAQLKPERLVQPKIRREFPDTAYWIADLKTGSDGGATANVVFPDSLTTWRATARGVTADTRVGQAIHKTIVRKNLLLTIAAPRFLTEGDDITIPVLVRNYLGTTQKVRVSMDVQGLDVLEGSAREVEIASKAEARVDFRYRVQKAQMKAVLLAKALGGVESDAMELTLPVEPDGVKWVTSTQGVLSDQAEQSAARQFDGRSAEQWRTVQIQVTPSVAGVIFGALDYLIGYPYGCVEQTMSSFLPNVIVTRAVSQLGVPLKEDPAELKRKVEAGLERLYRFQHEDGGWGWWMGDESSPFMTAYVTGGLKMAMDAGYKVEGWRIEQAAKRLAAFLEAPKTKGEADVAAWQLYALAGVGKANRAQLDKVWNLRPDFTPMGWALAGMSARHFNDNRAQEAALQLEAGAKRSGGEVWWPSTRDLMLDFGHDATPEATAYALKFLTQMNSTPEVLDGAAQWLVAHRSQGYYWSSTKQTAMVIFGMIDYLKRSGELKPDFRLEVLLNGKSIMTRRFTAADALSPAPIRVRMPGSETGERFEVKVRKEGTGRAYWSVTEEMRLKEEKLVTPPEWPMRIEREYYRMTPRRQGERIVYQLEPVSGPVNTGDLLAVRLSVRGAEESFVLVEDMLPSGAEIVPRDDLYPVERRPGWWRSWYERREVRDSRITYFPTYLDKQGMEYTYLLRVTNAGVFHIPPARVEPMYRPGYISSSAAYVLEVQ